MEDFARASALAWGLAALGLVLLFALTASIEAALVVVGLTRAQVLAAEPSASRRARALAHLMAGPEATSATVRMVMVLACLSSGVLGALAGLGCLSRWMPLWCAMAIGVLVVALLALAASAAGRALGASHGEAVALALALPIRGLRTFCGPIGAALAAVARPFGAPGRFSLPRPPLEEMERDLAEYAKTAGTPSDQSTSELIRNVFEFRDKVARDVMVPRTNVVAVEIETPVPEIIRILAEEGHSRMPVYRNALDSIVGTLHARDLVPLLAHPELIVLRDLIRPPHFVPWSKPIDQLLREMQRRKLHMAIVVDEYGGVMGICTVEDVLEQIVGEIQDEFEEEERREVEPHPDGTFTVRGGAPVAEFNKLAGDVLPEGKGYETVGGFLNALAGAIPALGDRFLYRDWMFTVSEANPRRVVRLRAARVRRPPGGKV